LSPGGLQQAKAADSVIAAPPSDKLKVMSQPSNTQRPP
jgi:hypothetical protein